MESLKIRDKKINTPEEIVPIEEPKAKKTDTVEVSEEENKPQMPQNDLPEETPKYDVRTKRGSSKPTFGQSLMEKVKKFFEEVE